MIQYPMVNTFPVSICFPCILYLFISNQNKIITFVLSVSKNVVLLSRDGFKLYIMHLLGMHRKGNSWSEPNVGNSWPKTEYPNMIIVIHLFSYH